MSGPGSTATRSVRFRANGPGNMLTMTALQAALLRRWVEGDFIADWPAAAPPPRSTRCRSREQPAMLDKSALHFCLADTFHPGCEMTWPMRHASMYDKPFRIRHRPAGAAGAGLRRDAQSADRPAGRRSALCAGPRRHHALDGAAVAGRHRLLPFRLRPRIRSLCADVLGRRACRTRC